MTSHDPQIDVIVVGAGNAALCAALSAREAGASVAVLEKAPPSEQGGNCPFTGAGFRFTHNGIADLRCLIPELTDEDIARIDMAPYTPDDFRAHLTTVTHGKTLPHLMETLIAESRPTVEWMRAKGVEWELPGTRQSEGRPPSTIPSAVGLSARGSGKGLVEMLTRLSRRNGIQVLYETRMDRLLQNPGGAVVGVEVTDADGTHEIRADGVALACGGFEASPEMRAQYIGENWSMAKVRGAGHNTGDGHRVAMAAGAAVTGQWDGCHCTPIDVAAPTEAGDLALTNAMPRRAYPLGITVNLAGLRFINEGEGFAEQTFVDIGRGIIEQQRGLAFQVFDTRAAPLLEDRYGSAERFEAGTVRELATALGCDADGLEDTISAFNLEAQEGEYEPHKLDGRSTRTLDPPKSNWAIKIDTPPYVGYKVTCGITYTYGGLAIDRESRVLNGDGNPIPGLCAAGEIVGGIFYHNSLRAAGLMHGAVFGRIAGRTTAAMRRSA